MGTLKSTVYTILNVLYRARSRREQMNQKRALNVFARSGIRAVASFFMSTIQSHWTTLTYSIVCDPVIKPKVSRLPAQERRCKQKAPHGVVKHPPECYCDGISSITEMESSPFPPRALSEVDLLLVNVKLGKRPLICMTTIIEITIAPCPLARCPQIYAKSGEKLRFKYLKVSGNSDVLYSNVICSNMISQTNNKFNYCRE